MPNAKKNERLKIPCETQYVAALGLTAYAFARLEWNAVWCCERIQPGIIRELSEKTAGGIAKKLISLATALLPSSNKDQLLMVANEFQELVKTRNAILHGKPGTAKDGGQRLFRNGKVWTREDFDDASDKFTACSMRLNSFLYGFLESVPTRSL